MGEAFSQPFDLRLAGPLHRARRVRDGEHGRRGYQSLRHRDWGHRHDQEARKLPVLFYFCEANDP